MQYFSMEKESKHIEYLQRLCRLCGLRKGKEKLRNFNDNSKRAMQDRYHICVENDDPYQYPSKICLSCMLHLKRLATGPKEKIRKLFTFPKINKKTRNSNSCDDNCIICYEGTRPGFSKSGPEFEGIKISKGRPSQQSPIETRCSKCWDIIKEIKTHVCSSKESGISYLKERLEKKGMADPLLGKLYRDKKPGSSVKNLRGRPTKLPTEKVMEKVKMDELQELVTQSGGKGGISRSVIRAFRKLLSKRKIKLPNEIAISILKKARVGDLFIKTTEPMEYGKKYERNIVDTDIVFCNDVIELIHRCKAIHNIDTIDEELRVTIGIDSGQGTTKMTMQLLEVATNSVHYTIVLAATVAPETTNNLKVIINKVDFTSLDDKFSIGISSDVKVLQIIFGLMGGNATYPCPICLWPASKGLCPEDYQSRTNSSLIENHSKLMNRYKGNSKKHAADCFGTEALPLVSSNPIDIVKVPTVHLHLLVNTIYDYIRNNSSPEELNDFMTECKRYGVQETKYHGHSLEGKEVNFSYFTRRVS